MMYHTTRNTTYMSGDWSLSQRNKEVPYNEEDHIQVERVVSKSGKQGCTISRGRPHPSWVNSLKTDFKKAEEKYKCREELSDGEKWKNM